MTSHPFRSLPHPCTRFLFRLFFLSSRGCQRTCLQVHRVRSVVRLCETTTLPFALAPNVTACFRGEHLFGVLRRGSVNVRVFAFVFFRRDGNVQDSAESTGPKAVCYKQEVSWVCVGLNESFLPISMRTSRMSILPHGTFLTFGSLEWSKLCIFK